MGTWDWEDVPHEECSFDGAPAAALRSAKFAQLITSEFEELPKKSDLPMLSLVERSLSDEVPSIFRTLREAGSTRGFVVSVGDEDENTGFYRIVDISEEVANCIMNDSAMDVPMSFVDDTGRCLLASYWSDFAWIGMSPDLFENWLSQCQLDLTLWCGSAPWPVARNFAHARELAERRTSLWTEHCNKQRHGVD